VIGSENGKLLRRRRQKESIKREAGGGPVQREVRQKPGEFWEGKFFENIAKCQRALGHFKTAVGKKNIKRPKDRGRLGRENLGLHLEKPHQLSIRKAYRIMGRGRDRGKTHSDQMALYAD